MPIFFVQTKVFVCVGLKKTKNTFRKIDVSAFELYVLYLVVPEINILQSRNIISQTVHLKSFQLLNKLPDIGGTAA